jgi:hypothetical protein
MEHLNMSLTSVLPEYIDQGFAADILEGAAAIAAHTGKSLRQTHYLLETGQLPAFKMGKIWHMRRSTFERHIEELEAAAQENARKQ